MRCAGRQGSGHRPCYRHCYSAGDSPLGNQMSSIRVALAQLNPTVGDVPGNRAAIASAATRAAEQGAELLITPELSLLGYPPRDLLRRDSLIETQLGALEELAGSVPLPTVVGVADRNPGTGRALQNVAALVDDGEVVTRARKRLLPTYDVFEEARYFEPGDRPCVVDIGGTQVGLSVCEDAWTQTSIDGTRRYDADPIAELAADGADLLVNISASPFYLGKGAQRERLFADHASSTELPVVFVNQVGGNDELLFDGASFALGSGGRPLARGADWEQDLLIVDIPGEERPDADRLPVGSASPDHEAAQARQAIRVGIRDYVNKSGFEEVILGMSGGVDSTVATVLAAEALGPANVRGVAMPGRYTADASTADARAVARRLGIEFDIIPIDEPVAAFQGQLEPVFEGTDPDETEENLQARVRGTTLMALSNKFDALVLTPDNKSESAVGYCTLYGDMVGALAPLGDCLKGLVYAIAGELNERPDPRFDGAPIPARVCERPPSAELKADQTDADDLPPYEIIDPIVSAYMEAGADRAELLAAGHEKALVDRVLGLLERSEYKRWQEVPVVRLTSQAFGMGWRYPLAANFPQSL